MPFPLSGLTFVRCADVSPAAASVEAYQDAIYSAVTAANDYRGTAKPSTHAWTVTKRQVTGVTQAIQFEPPASSGVGVSPVFFLGGRTALAVTPPLLSPDISGNGIIFVGVNKNGGAYNSWDAAFPMTSGQFSGYYRAIQSLYIGTATIIRVYVSQETILIQSMQTATSQGWTYFGAMIQPYTNDTSVCSETDGRIYGMCVSGSTAVTSTWLATASQMFSHNVSASALHCAVFQPNTANMWACGTRTIYSTGGGTIPETQDSSGAYIGDSFDFGRNIGTTGANTGTRLGTLRGIYRAGNVISGRWLRSGSTDLYHYVSTDTANVANAIMLPAVS